MRVLITGGYGFIGSFAAERFHQEGCEVFILDNLSSGDRSHVPFKHVSYQMSIEDQRCEEAFRNGRFDVVVHLAAQTSVAVSIRDPRADSSVNLTGLTNMLALSVKYGVKKFIMVSSAAVYGTCQNIPLDEMQACDPMSPYGLSKWTGEQYCQKWRELYGIETLIFRLSNVYGPRQGSAGEGGVISKFLENAIAGKPLTVYGDGSQTRDFIFVRDVADAIYRASYSTLTGIYNLSTARETTVSELIDQLEKLHGPVQTEYKDKRQGDIYRSALENRKIRKELDWAPRYDLPKGLEITYNWFLSQTETAAAAEEASAPLAKKSSALFRVLKPALPYMENFAFFAVTAWLSGMFAGSFYEFLDFKLVYILILGMIYGNRQAILSVALATALFTYEQLSNGREMIALMYDTDYFFKISIYLFVGLVVGYTVERRSILLSSVRRQLEELEEKYAFLNEIYRETRQVKEELQQQILNNGDSFGKIYAITKNLESLEPEKIFTSTVSVVESIMKTDSVSIYTVNKYGSYLRLMAKSNGSHFEAPKSLKVEDHAFIQAILQDKKHFVNRQLVPDVPLMAAPVLSEGRVMAVIALHHIPFENFTLYFQNLFQVTVELVSSALSRAFSFVEATANRRYIEGSAILKPEVFKEILDSKRTAHALYGVEYVLMTPAAKLPESELGPLSMDISRSLRETDYLGLSENGSLLMLLSNSTKEDARFVIQRLKQAGIEMMFVNEELPNVG